MSFFIYGWAFFISNIVLLMMLLVIDEEENQFIENGSKANKVFALPSIPTLILSSYLWVGSYFESESHSRSWSSFMPPLRCLLIDSNAPQKSLTRITKLGKQTVSKKHSWNLKTRYAFLRFTMRGFQIGRMMLMSENWNGLESSLMLDSSKLRILMSMNCKVHSIWYVVDTA